MNNTIGIDFGTTKTLVSYWDEVRGALIATLGGTKCDIPTVVHMDKSGVLTFGDDAEALSEIDPKGYLPQIKRNLGTEKMHLLNGHNRNTVQLVTAFLEYVKKRMEEELPQLKNVHNAVITVPAMYGKPARDQLTAAAKKAGFKKVDLLDEPESAGIAYLAEITDDNDYERMLVFDWGGGTLDIAVLERNGNGYGPHSELIDGDRSLGGEDLDDLLVAVLDKQFTDVGDKPIHSLSSGEKIMIRKRVRDYKIAHSKRSEVNWVIRFDGLSQPYQRTWTREDFNSVIQPDVDTALEHTSRVLEKAREIGVTVQHVLLVGGSSQIPIVKDLLQKKLGLTPIPWQHSLTGVALGAVHKAFQTAPNKIFPPTNTTPRKATFPSKDMPILATNELPYENRLGMKFVPVAGTDVLFSIWLTRVKDFWLFAEATGYETKEDWKYTGFAQTDYHPVMKLSWDDAKAFCKWLTESERNAGRMGGGQEYRLPTDSEWSVAVGDSKYPWGNSWPPPPGVGNYSTLEVQSDICTSPVGSFAPNRFGLFDMGGSVEQWCEDWYSEAKTHRLLRGYSILLGGSLATPDSLVSSYRNGFIPNCGGRFIGFRCVLVGAKLTTVMDSKETISSERRKGQPVISMNRSIDNEKNQALALDYYNMGLKYELGAEVQLDFNEANKWFDLAAKLGNPEAQFIIGYHYERGSRGFEKSDREATKWFRLAAEQGYADAQYYLALIYSMETEVGKNESESLKWCFLAAENGNANAQYILGGHYYSGRHLKQSAAEAYKWFRLAAEPRIRSQHRYYDENVNGRARCEAPYVLGQMCFTGQGVTQSYTEALKWYSISAETHYRGQYELGWMYYNGQGVQKNDAEAVKWLRRAREPEAKEILKRLSWHLKARDCLFSIFRDY